MFGTGLPLSPLGCLIFGAAALGLGVVEIIVVAIQPKWWTKRRGLHARWGFGSSLGPPVSRIGGTAWGLSLSVVGATSILNGYLGVLSRALVMPILLSAFFLVFIAAIIDNWRYKRRKVRRLNRQ
jgi:hypothetical protein